MKSSFGSSHRRRTKYKSKKISKEKEATVKAHVQKQMDDYLALLDPKLITGETLVEEPVVEESRSLIVVEKTQALEDLLQDTTARSAVIGVQGRKASKGVDREHRSSTVQRHAQFQTRSKSSIALKGRGKTLHLPLFCSVDSRAFVSWLYEVECYFESNQFSEEKKSKLVISCLRGDALTWFNNATCANKAGMAKMKYWHRLRSYLKGKFISKCFMLDLKNELESLNQGSLSVHGYMSMFNELRFILGGSDDTFQKRTCFYNGLNSEIANWINVDDMNSYDLLCDLSLLAEKLIHETKVYVASLAKTNCLLDGIQLGNERALEDGMGEYRNANFWIFPKMVNSEIRFLHRPSFSIVAIVERTVTSTVLGAVPNVFQNLEPSHDVDIETVGWFSYCLATKACFVHAYNEQATIRIDASNFGKYTPYIEDDELKEKSFRGFPFDLQPAKDDQYTQAKPLRLYVLFMSQLDVCLEDTLIRLCGCILSCQETKSRGRKSVFRSLDPRKENVWADGEITLRARQEELQQPNVNFYSKEILKSAETWTRILRLSTSANGVGVIVYIRKRYCIKVFDPGGIQFSLHGH